jgi:hypothetical protein
MPFTGVTVSTCKRRSSRRFGRPEGLLTLAVLLGGCAAPLTAETRYAGAVTPSGGICLTDANRPPHGTLTVKGEHVAFAPDDGTLVIPGRIEADGGIFAQRDTPGANHKPFVMRLQARRQGDSITGTFTTPRCTSNVSLTRVHMPVF